MTISRKRNTNKPFHHSILSRNVKFFETNLHRSDFSFGFCLLYHSKSGFHLKNWRQFKTIVAHFNWHFDFVDQIEQKVLEWVLNFCFSSASLFRLSELGVSGLPIPGKFFSEMSKFSHFTREKWRQVFQLFKVFISGHKKDLELEMF
jgi:hypothetical protein